MIKGLDLIIFSTHVYLHTIAFLSTIARYKTFLQPFHRIKIFACVVSAWTISDSYLLTTLHWRHNERDGVWNPQSRDCSLSRLFRRRTREHQSTAPLAVGRWIHRWPVNSPYKGPVRRKIFPFDDAIMSYARVITGIVQSRSCCSLDISLKLILKSTPEKSRLPLTYFTIAQSFRFFYRARIYHCRALCTISQQRKTERDAIGERCFHYNDIIMSAMASQITSPTIVYPTVNSGTAQTKHQSSASLFFLRGIHQWTVNSPQKLMASNAKNVSIRWCHHVICLWPVNSLQKGPVTRKKFPLDDVIMHKIWV